MKKKSVVYHEKKQCIFSKLFYPYWKYRYLFLLFLPALLYYIVFCYGPMYGIQIAFKDYSLTKGISQSPWVGMKYFERLFSMKGFWSVFWNTITISGLKLIFGFPIPIIFALLLNELRQKHFKKVVQTISYLPHFLSWIILVSLFTQLLSPSIGPVNQILKAMGLNEIYFMADTKWFRPVVVFTSVWKELGWGTVVYLAAITGCNPELYEAAAIDGARRFQKVLYITLPELAAVITIMFIFAVGGIVNDDFDQIFNMLNNAVLNKGDVISTYVYRIGLENMQYSFSTAVGLFKNVIAFVLVMATNSISKRISDYGIW